MNTVFLSGQREGEQLAKSGVVTPPSKYVSPQENFLPVYPVALALDSLLRQQCDFWLWHMKDKTSHDPQAVAHIHGQVEELVDSEQQVFEDDWKECWKEIHFFARRLLLIYFERTDRITAEGTFILDRASWILLMRSEELTCPVFAIIPLLRKYVKTEM